MKIFLLMRLKRLTIIDLEIVTHLKPRKENLVVKTYLAINKSKNRFKIALSVVAIIVFTTVLLFPKNDDSEVNKTLIQIEVAKFEKEYLKNINKEWQQFLAISNDSILIKKYEVKLKGFDTDYKKITKNLEKNPNNINVLEALINNLQRRLELIKNIKEHIKELNQKNTSNETIYI